MPLISFIIPVYNVEFFLNECIDSVINQNLSSYEIILVNDGSTDGSLRICNQYLKKKEVKVINQENKGQSSARNRGIMEATGEYIAFLDSDDFYIPDALKEFEKKIIKDKNIDLVVGKIKTFYDNSEKVSPKTNYLNFGYINNLTGEEALCYLTKTNQFVISPYSYIVKRKILINNKIFFNEKLRCGEDILFTPKIYFKVLKIACIENYFLMYRKGRIGQITGTITLKKEETVLEILATLHKETDTLKITDKTKRSFKRYIANSYMVSLGKLKNKNKLKERKQLYKKYKYLARNAGGRRYIIPKIVFILFGFDICLIFMNCLLIIFRKIQVFKNNKLVRLNRL